MTIDINNIINISLTSTPQGLENANINSVAIFTTELPSNLDPYRIYTNSRQVATDYGTNSQAAKMANAIFAQSPNILSGEGRLVTIPLINSISAVEGKYETTDITANLSNILAVSNGDIRVVLNGNNIDLTDLDFTGASTFEDIAKILQNRLNNAVVESKATGFDILSKKVGASSTVDLVQLPAGTGTDLSTASLFNVVAGTATGGNNAQGETILEALTRTEEDVAYYGFITDLQMEDAVIKTLATGVQSRDKYYVETFASTEDVEPTTGICSQIKDASETKTRCILYTKGIDDRNLAKAAYISRGSSVNFAGSNTTNTLNLKSLVGVTPDNSINQTILDKTEIAGADIYTSVSSLSVVLSFGSNDYFDNIYNDLWFKLALEVAGFNYLRQTNTKIPQTEQGMEGLKGAWGKVCEQGIRNGMIAAGTWNSSETFGNPDDLRRNISDIGYYIYSLPIALQSQADREQRKAPLGQIAIKRAGAIHSSDVIVVIED